MGRTGELRGVQESAADGLRTATVRELKRARVVEFDVPTGMVFRLRSVCSSKPGGYRVHSLYDTQDSSNIFMSIQACRFGYEFDLKVHISLLD